MADIFYRCDAVKLLHKKHIMFLGDSNSRAIYKDVIWLLNRNSLIKQADLRRKQEPSFCGDKLGKHSALNRGRYYEEERFYKRNGTQVDFYFLTKCYNDTLVDMMEDIHLRTKKAPDVICINSTLWDVCRWGPNSITQFKDNLQKLAKLLKCSLPPTTLVIWLTSLPVSFKIQSSFIIKQIDFLRYTLRFDVMEANNFARQVMVAHGFDVLDNHFHMRMQIHRRIHDGVHYEPTAIRFLTNLLLTHIALSWGRPLPNRIDTLLLDKAKALSSANKGSPTVDIKSTPSKIKKQPIENSSTRNDHNLVPKQRYRNKRNNRERRLAQHEVIEKHQHPVIKSVNNRNKSWNIDNQRSWPNSSYSIRNETQWRESSYTPQLWDNDYRSSERHFEEHHQYDPGFSSNPRFYRNFHQSNNFPSSFSGRGRQSRYAPY